MFAFLQKENASGVEELRYQNCQYCAMKIVQKRTHTENIKVKTKKIWHDFDVGHCGYNVSHGMIYNKFDSSKLKKKSSDLQIYTFNVIIIPIFHSFTLQY